MDVAQSFSSSEAATSEDETVDEDISYVLLWSGRLRLERPHLARPKFLLVV